MNRRPNANPSPNPSPNPNDDSDELDEQEARDAPVYPLLPDLALGSVAYLVIHRILADDNERPNVARRAPAWPKRFEPLTTDEFAIADECGGGTYDVLARNAKGQAVGGCRVEILGEPKQPNVKPLPVAQSPPSAGAAQHAQHAQQTLLDPIQQTANGTLGIRGADPGQNAILAMLQQQSQQQAESNRLAQERLERLEARQSQEKMDEKARLEKRDEDVRREKAEEKRAQEDREEKRRIETEAREERRRTETEARLRDERDRADRLADQARKDAEARADMMIKLMETVSKPPPLPPVDTNEKFIFTFLNDQLKETRDQLANERRENKLDERRAENRAAQQKQTETAAAQPGMMEFAERALTAIATMPEIQKKAAELLGPIAAEVLRPVAQSVIAATLNEMANQQAPQLAPAPPVQVAGPVLSNAGLESFPMPATNGAS